jgi:1-hydroxy-2-isopentenylcarotenoid 3,4-desaturase
MGKKVVIIGGGLSGLSSAALLGREGYAVTVVEKHSVPGGVARVARENGFVFDMGPTWYLMPEVFEHFFELFDKNISDYYELVELDPSYQVFFEGKGNVTLSRDREANKKIFDLFEPDGGEKLDRYLANSAVKYSIAVNEFLYREFTGFFQFLNMRVLRDGLKLNIFRRLDAFMNKYFTSSEARKVLGFNTVFLGSSPYKTPALYSLMSHADLTQGVFYPMGGIGSMVEALHKLGEEQGVTYRFSENATKIEVTDRKTTGVTTDKGFISADIVLSSVDYHYTDTTLLDKPYANYSHTYWKKRVMAPSTFLIFLGLTKKVENLMHHNFFFVEDWEGNFRMIFDEKSWPEHPSYYVGVPSKTDTTLCPEGGETLFILVPVAPGLDDPDEFRERYAENVLVHLEGLTGQEIRSHIAYKRIISHRDFIDGNNIYKGSSLGLAHTLFQTALLRPSHRSKKVPNLYYTGHYTQPGIGMPMQLIGSELVAKRIKDEMGTE